MNSRRLCNLHQRHIFLRAEASRDILKFKVSEIAFPRVFKRYFPPRMQCCQNTRNTGNNAIKMSQAFHDIARFKRFTHLNQFNVHSMSFKTGTRMLYNILFVGAYFSIAGIVDGDESSQQRLLLVFVLNKLNKLIAPFCRKKMQKSENHKTNNRSTLCKYKKWMLVTDKLKAQ